MLSNDDEDNDDNIICTSWAHLYAKHFIFNISSNPYNASMTERQVQLHFIEKEKEAACDLMHILQLVGGGARRVTLVLTTPHPAAPSPDGCTADCIPNSSVCWACILSNSPWSSCRAFSSKACISSRCVWCWIWRLWLDSFFKRSSVACGHKWEEGGMKAGTEGRPVPFA